MIANTETEALILKIITMLADAFPSQAILKGGMELRLLNCPRYTNDIDYVFIPFSSKKDILAPVLEVLHKEPSFTITHTVHSTCIRIIVVTISARIQVELNVAESCKSQALTTSELSRMHNMQGRIIRAMSLDVALSHKLAAWLERNLMRDVYDIYFMRERLLISPEITTLSDRLSRIHYQRKNHKGPKSLTVNEFSTLLRQYSATVTLEMVHAELDDLLDFNEFPGLDIKLRSALIGIAEALER